MIFLSAVTMFVIPQFDVDQKLPFQRFKLQQLTVCAAGGYIADKYQFLWPDQAASEHRVAYDLACPRVGVFGGDCRWPLVLAVGMDWLRFPCLAVDCPCTLFAALALVGQRGSPASKRGAPLAVFRRF